MFIIDTSYDVPDELISFARLLLMEAPEWNEAKSKRKLPKAKVDERVLTVAADVLQKRIAEYPTTLKVRRLRVKLPVRVFMPSQRRTKSCYPNVKSPSSP